MLVLRNQLMKHPLILRKDENILNYFHVGMMQSNENHLSGYFKKLHHFHNILRIFDVLTNFLFTTSEIMHNY